MISNRELLDPLCGSVNRGLTFSQIGRQVVWNENKEHAVLIFL